MDAHRVAELATEVGLGEIADELAALSWLAWRLVYDPPRGAPRPPAPLGTSKLGGTPDLPPGVEWPRSGRDGTPTAFIGQLAVADFDGAIRWPGRDRGLLLSFFCDLDPDAAYAEGPDAGIVLAHPVAAGLVRHTRPDDLIEFRELRELVVRGTPERVLPHAIGKTCEPLRALGLDEGGAHEALSEEYGTLVWRMEREQRAPDGAPLVHHHAHQLLGTGATQHGDVVHWFASCHRERYPAAREAARWRLLLKVESDVDHLGVQWGTIFYGIREDDLAADHFDRIETFSAIS